MRYGRKNEGLALILLLKIGGGFLTGGLLLFMHVWAPIQAERALTRLRKIEADVFSKKAELNALNQHFTSITSLAALDHWARGHGPWKTPNADDVVAIRR